MRSKRDEERGRRARRERGWVEGGKERERERERQRETDERKEIGGERACTMQLYTEKEKQR